MKKENTNLPLWKVLNEQRTQGEWVAENGQEMNEYLVRTPEMDIATVLAIDIPDEEGQANAQYTALAVNNLHILAETLEGIMERSLNLLVEIIDIPHPTSMKEDMNKLRDEYKKAKEALNRIS